MSKLIAVRLPNDVIQLMGDKPVSETVIAALREYLGTERARGRELVGERKPDGAERHIEQSARQQCHAEPEGTRVQVPPSVVKHAETCRCYICKPPTP